MSSPQMAFSGTIKGLSDFLFQCRSVSLATAVRDELDNVARDKKLLPNTPLSFDTLEEVRQGLYRRTRDSRVEADIFLMLADAMSGSGATSGNPLEDRLRFVEALQRQLKDNGRVDFQRAYAVAISKPLS